MKCEVVQKQLNLYLKDELSVKQSLALEAHLGACEACRSELAYLKALENRLNVPLEPSPSLASRLHAQLMLDPSPRRSFLSGLTQTLGGTTMKKSLILTGAAAVILALGLMSIISPRAQAASPKEKFNAVKNAFNAARALGKVALSITFNPDNKSGMKECQVWTRKGLVKLVPNESHFFELEDFFHSDEEPSKDLPKEVREAIKESKNTKGTNLEDISELSELNGRLQQYGLSFELVYLFTFSTDSFNINYEKENTLQLINKKQSNTRYKISIDPKTNLPLSSVKEVFKKGEWVCSQKISYVYRKSMK